ncbi:hypothetical protein K1X13_10495 [Nocardioides sp. WL0053]|uniref:Lipoprotein n=1 Tax=Nocardioides jiangsuensis TaxID=2866161 RepID=A0ABS7RJR1_9ACTN|nr:hypothetical protein [Nocardioides jiangsuensis]MBY9075246.1 hypothetical protein [Nocardioides jiangsuensis]
MRRSFGWPVAAALLVLGASACGGTSAEGQRGTDEETPTSDADAWVSAEDYHPDRFAESAQVDHRWYPLEPGTRADYRGSSIEEGERLHHGVTIIVTDLVKVIDGVPNVVVWERDYTDGELVETELALFAQDEDGNIWHMGEYPEEWEDGEFDKAPAWVHGIAGATAGITIPADPRTGTPDYAQGFAPKPINWVDRGRVYKTGERTCVPEACYSDVVVVEEFERTIPDAFQDKYYAPGVGVVRVGWRGENDESKEVLELVDFRRLSPEELAEVREDARALEDRAYRISADVFGQTPRSEVASP